jgi:hypothetical protein
MDNYAYTKIVTVPPCEDSLCTVENPTSYTVRLSPVVRNDWSERRIVKSRALWEELHTKESPTEEWFKDWLSRIPRYGCSCSKDFQAILEAIPVDYRNFFVWSVRVHNEVNKKLGKPTFSLEAAKERWGYQEEAG